MSPLALPDSRSAHSPARASAPHGGAGTPGPDDGVIEEARRRQRRRQLRGFCGALVALGATAGLSWALLATGGSGGARHGSPRLSHSASPSYSVGDGIRVSYPHGWHLMRAPITSLAYPYDRMLLTSYAAVRGGECGPTRAENSLPSGGALVFLSEYSSTPGSVVAEPKGVSFPPQSSGFTLPKSELRNYECSTVPSYIVRFRSAGRLFQAQLAFGERATQARRAEALQILSGLRVQPLGAKSG